MKKAFIKFISVLLILSTLVTTAYAQTPDGDKPLTSAFKNKTPNSSAAPSGGVKRPAGTSHVNMQKKIKEAAAVNKDVVGWLVIPNTNINSPVPFTDTDNDYYLYRTWDKKHYPDLSYKNYVNTANYLDYRTIFGTSWKSSSKNMVIYGHNWTNLRSPLDIGKDNKHTMLGQLPSYTDIEFAKANPHIYFSTEEFDGVWRVFAVAYTEINPNFNYNKPNMSKEEAAKVIAELKDRSMFDFGIEVDESDKLLTLSTCTRFYGTSSSQRFIVVARLLRKGETIGDKVTVKVNKDVKKPALNS